MTPGWGQFWPQGHNLNKLGRGLLGDATYQISRLFAMWISQEDCFHVVFPIKAYVKDVTPGRGHF